MIRVKWQWLLNTCLDNNTRYASQVIFSEITLGPHLDLLGYSMRILANSLWILQLYCHNWDAEIWTVVVGTIVNSICYISSGGATHS